MISHFHLNQQITVNWLACSTHVYQKNSDKVTKEVKTLHFNVSYPGLNFLLGEIYHNIDKSVIYEGRRRMTEL